MVIQLKDFLIFCILVSLSVNAIYLQFLSFYHVGNSLESLVLERDCWILGSRLQIFDPKCCKNWWIFRPDFLGSSDTLDTVVWQFNERILPWPLLKLCYFLFCNFFIYDLVFLKTRFLELVFLFMRGLCFLVGIVITFKRLMRWKM